MLMRRWYRSAYKASNCGLTSPTWRMGLMERVLLIVVAMGMGLVVRPNGIPSNVSLTSLGTQVCQTPPAGIGIIRA